MKTIAVMAGAALATVLSAPAAAQDAASWTGPYVGAKIGYSWQPSDLDEQLDFDTNLDGSFGDTVRTAAGANAFSPGFCDGVAVNSLRTSGCSRDKDAVTYAGMVGFDYQIGTSIVVGVVAEYGNANINDSVSGFSTTPANYVLTRSLRGTGALRARAGYALNNTLVYGTGGLAYGRVRTRYGTTNNANSFTDQAGNDARQNAYKDDRWGYTFGGGIEQRVAPNFSIGVLYSYTSLKDNDYRLRVGRGGAPANNPFLLVNATGTDIRRSHSEFNRHDVSATASFRF